MQQVVLADVVAQAKVDDLDLPGYVKHNVVGLQVAVHDVVGVQVLDGEEDLHGAWCRSRRGMVRDTRSVCLTHTKHRGNDSRH